MDGWMEGMMQIVKKEEKWYGSYSRLPIDHQAKSSGRQENERRRGKSSINALIYDNGFPFVITG